MDEHDRIYAAASAEPYLPEHFPDAQRLVDGVPVDPAQRDSFDITANEDRDSLEVSDWWGLPYVVSQPHWRVDACYTDYCKRMTEYGFDVRKTEAEYDAQIESERRAWFEHWPSGVRYDVRCLDGGAWDRSTWRGSFATLPEAVAHARALIAQGGPVLGAHLGIRTG